jgi:L-iditol 2-dehydrogenase
MLIDDVHALERAKLTGLANFRSRVLIQGCGRGAGVQHIVALDGDDGRLGMAARMGAEHVINYKNHAGLWNWSPP